MIQVSRLNKAYAGQVLFEDMTFSLQKREKVGLIGRNGHGKSTLFRILLGQEEADSGDIAIPRGYRIGHLPQTIQFKERTVLAEACLGLPVGHEDEEWQARRILEGLGFSEEGMESSPQSFSGGFQLRINLAKLLLSDPDLLLLDEPTNYLDIVSVRWLQSELQQWRGELILISHDREFMDSVTTHSMMIHRGKVKKSEGDTHKLQDLIAQDEELYEKTRASQLKRKEEAEAFITRFRAQASKATLVQSRIKELEKMNIGDELSEIQSLDFNFTEQPFEAKYLLHCEDLRFGYTAEDLLIKNLSFAVKKNARIGVIGKNGRGKSTLMNLIAGGLKPLGGSIKAHAQMSLGYFGQTNVARLTMTNTVETEIMEANPLLGRTRIRGICGAMMFSGKMAEKKISVLSGGERSRVLLGKILAHPHNLLLLDEPTSHLDMDSIDALVESLRAFDGGVMIVTHSEMILRELCDSLIIFGDSGLRFFEGSYEDFLERVGWESDAEVVPTTERKKNDEDEKVIEKPKSGKVSDGNWKKRKLQEEFSELDGKLIELNARITELSDAGKVDALIEATKEREDLEVRQLQVLESLEEMK